MTALDLIEALSYLALAACFVALWPTVPKWRRDWIKWRNGRRKR